MKTDTRTNRLTLAALASVGMLASCNRGQDSAQQGEDESVSAHLSLGGTGINTGVQPAACLADWRNTTCGQWCLRQTQPDRANCRVFLDCYRSHSCGPDTCGKNPDDICGVNKVIPAMGMAPKIIADEVARCLGCSGVGPTCIAVAATARTDNTGGPNGQVGSQTFGTANYAILPRFISVIEGSAGNGAATLSFQTEGACPTCWKQCSYVGLASSPHPTTPEQIARGRVYALLSCDSGTDPAQPQPFRAIKLRLLRSDPQVGATTAQLNIPCSVTNIKSVAPVPPGVIQEKGNVVPGRTPETALPTPSGEPAFPIPYLPPSNPEVNGGYTPLPNTRLIPIDLPYPES